MLNSNQYLGKKGEEIAADFLKKNGYVLRVKNYRCRYGEIDIVASFGDVVVFIEVKTRTGSTFGNPAEAVTRRKQKQISRTAQHYLAEQNLFDTSARFDVVSIVVSPGRPPSVEIISGAFDFCEG